MYLHDSAVGHWVLSRSTAVGYIGFGFTRMRNKWAILQTATGRLELLTRPKVMGYNWVSNHLCQVYLWMLRQQVCYTNLQQSHTVLGSEDG